MSVKRILPFLGSLALEVVDHPLVDAGVGHANIVGTMLSTWSH